MFTELPGLPTEPKTWAFFGICVAAVIVFCLTVGERFEQWLSDEQDHEE